MNNFKNGACSVYSISKFKDTTQGTAVAESTDTRSGMITF